MDISLDFLQTEIREPTHTEHEGKAGELMSKAEQAMNNAIVRPMNNYEEARRYLPPPWGEDVDCRNKYKGKWVFFSNRGFEAAGNDYEKTAKRAVKNSKLPFLELVAFHA